MSAGVSESKMEERERLLQEETKQARTQSYGTTPGYGGGNAKAQQASGYAPIPSAPPHSEGLHFPSGGPGSRSPPPGSGYPPAGQGYPPGGPGYPPTGQGYQQGQLGYQPGGQSYPSGQAPSDDGAPGPSSPPAGLLDPIPGYDSITLENVPLLPPSYDDATRPAEPKHRKPLSGLPVISQEQARLALLEHCSAHCCYGTRAAQEMIILEMNSTSAFHYTLETFTEQRSTAWTQVPYTGFEPLDTPMNGPAPLPWDVVLYASQKFRSETKIVEVPHTACLKPCHTCRGSGYTSCNGCHGLGRSRCGSCGATGIRRFGTESQRCNFCSGAGYRQCISCDGTGRRRCHRCRGHGQLKWFIQLTVTWTNHFEDYILERYELPDELIRKAAGQMAFQEEQPWLYPINHCPEPSINNASKELIEKHRRVFPNERQLLQRQAIRIVPVTEVKCSWKQNSFTFFVYGLDNLVHTSDYPQMCCCGCTIL